MAGAERLPLLLLLAVACGEPAGPGGDAPALTAINGAGLPFIRPGDTLALEGRGFGLTQGNGSVRLGEEALAIVSWSPSAIVAVATTVMAESLLVTTGDGISIGPLGVRAAPTDTVSTSARPWSGGADLPAALAQAAAAGITFATGTGYTSLIVLSGGRRADGTLTDSTRIGRTDGTGTVTAWSAAPDTIVPIARRLHAMVGATALSSRLASGGVAWMIGGMDSTGRTLADVLGISVGLDGSYGFWTPLAPLPGDRAGSAATVGLGAIYVVGGFGTDSTARRDVLMAIINPEGTINGWFRGPDLPVALAFAGAAVIDDRLYVAGGETGLVHPDSSVTGQLTSAVYSLRLSRRTGFFADTAWTTEPVALVHARARHALYAAAGGLVVVGGVLVDSAVNDTEAARIAGGTLGAFQESTATARIGGPTRDGGAPAIRDGSGFAVVTVVGGTDAGGATSRVWWH